MQVVMYTTAYCPYCRMAEQLLGRYGVVPEAVRVDLDPAQRAAMQARTGRRTVPQIYIGELHVGGYDDLAALERQGLLAGLLAGTA
jgi:glutaredoxin 3